MADYDSDRYWEIDNIVANDIFGSMPTYTIGDKARIKFAFSPLPGETEKDCRERANTLRDRAKHAGAYNYDVTLNGQVVYSEQHRGETLLTGIQPPSSLQNRNGVWGLISGIDAIQPPKEHTDALRLTIDYLADYDEYSDKDAVSADLEREGFH